MKNRFITKGKKQRRIKMDRKKEVRETKKHRQATKKMKAIMRSEQEKDTKKMKLKEEKR